MATKKTQNYRSSSSGQFIVGAKASTKISGVEGLRPSKEMRATFGNFEKMGLSSEARRTILKDKYGKKG